MNKIDFVKKSWGEVPILELADTIGVVINELLEIALNLNLSTKNTPNIRRAWTKQEDEFLTNNSSHLSVREASNLLYRSHYATYQRIRMLGLNEMINKKERKF